MDNVLLVSRNLQFLVRTKRELGKYKGQFQVLVSQSVDSAEGELQRNKITVLVIDLSSTEGDETETLLGFPGRYPKIPCIVLRDAADESVVSGTRAASMFRLLEKPIDVNLLANAIIDWQDLPPPPSCFLPTALSPRPAVSRSTLCQADFL